MSFDPPEENEAWAIDEGFQYELWSDLDRELALYYGAATSPTAFAPLRRTVLLDDQGGLLLEYAGVDVNAHPAEVLADCRILFGQ